MDQEISFDKIMSICLKEGKDVKVQLPDASAAYRIRFMFYNWRKRQIKLANFSHWTELQLRQMVVKTTKMGLVTFSADPFIAGSMISAISIEETPSEHPYPFREEDFSRELEAPGRPTASSQQSFVGEKVPEGLARLGYVPGIGDTESLYCEEYRKSVRPPAQEPLAPVQSIQDQQSTSIEQCPPALDEDSSPSDIRSPSGQQQQQQQSEPQEQEQEKGEEKKD